MSTYAFFTLLISVIIFLATLFYIENYIRTRNKVLKLWDKKEKMFKIPHQYVYFHNFFKNLTFNNPRHTYIDDTTWNDLNLDLVFSKLNYSFTTIGDELLYVAIRDCTSSPHNVEEKIIKRIVSDREYRNKLSKHLSNLGKSYNSDSSKYFDSHYHYQKYNIIYLIMTVVPILSIYIIFLNNMIGIFILISSFLINTVLHHFLVAKQEKEYIDFYYSINIINTSHKLDKLNNNNNNNRFRFSILFLLSPFLIVKDPNNENWIFSIINGLKSLFNIDYHLYHFLLMIFKKNHSQYKNCWLNVANHDLNYSIALWRNTLPYYCLPEISDRSGISTSSIYHPLINEAVPNDIDFYKDILITGSNASGKSTFMKTIAINIILANNMNTTLSKKFIYKPGKVISAMDISDSISKGDSYFISEIKALKRILDSSQENTQLYCFFDELFKGTNTIDRISSGTSILSFFHKHKYMNIIAATHDIELTKFLNNKYEFYYFNENIIDENNIKFSYKLKKGVTNTSNAINLLEYHKFPSVVIDNANAIKNIILQSKIKL